MKMIVYLFAILIVKVLLTRGCSLAIILLSFVLKGKVLRRDKIKWNDYFLKLCENFAIKYATCIYLTATTLSSIVAYILFKMFKFQYPMFLTIILTITGLAFILCKYFIKGKNEILDAMREVHQFAMERKNDN